MARKPLIEPGSILPTETMLSRIVARDREKAGRAETEPQDLPQSNPEIRESNMTGHITDKLTDKQVTKQSSKADDNLTEQPENKLTDNLSAMQTDEPVPDIPKISTREKTAKRVGPPAAFPETDASPEPASLVESIRASLRVPAAETALKTVTLKMSAALDRKIEDHCYQTGRKKQDVIRDAVLLYFEAIELPEDS